MEGWEAMYMYWDFHGIQMEVSLGLPYVTS